MWMPRPAATRPTATLRPMRAGLARMVAVLRGATATVAAAAAIVGAVPPLSWEWLGPALALLCGWTAVYVAVAWTRGLKLWLVVADLGVTAVLLLSIGHLVPAAAVGGTVNWVSTAASMSVVSAQLGGTPLLTVPAGLLVAWCAAAGHSRAGSPAGGLTDLAILAGQTLVGAGVMLVAMRVERAAVGSFTRLQEAQATAALALARREDERAQLRMVHNGPLTTLTMALHGTAQVTGTLRRRAAVVLAALPRLAASGEPGRRGLVRLDERLSRVTVWYDPPLRVTAGLHPALVPAAVAEAITAAVSEALENTLRYAAADRAAIAVVTDADTVRVTVTDHGRGFDPGAKPAQGFGLREDLAGRMAAVGGRATVRSAPGAGTVVELEWPHG